MIGKRPAEEPERGVQMAFDEARMDGGAFGIDAAPARLARRDHGVVADGDHAAFVNGDGAMLEDAALIVQGDDIGMPDDEIDRGAWGLVHVLCLRPMKLERNTRPTSRAKRRTASALIEGSTP